MIRKGKRRRATAIVIRKGKVLLVKDRGTHSYSLPGGGFKPYEDTKDASARELHEELGMNVYSVKRIASADTVTRHSIHKIAVMKSKDTPMVRDRELVDFIWWDRKSHIDRFAHVDKILRKVDMAKFTPLTPFKAMLDFFLFVRDSLFPVDQKMSYHYAYAKDRRYIEKV